MPETATLTRALAIWALMAAGAVANGALREAMLIPSLGEGVARPLSALLLLAIVYALAWVFWTWSGRPMRPAVLWAVGLLWFTLTVAFEAGLGFWRGMNLSEVLSLYNPLNPTLWFFCLVGVLVAPVLVALSSKGQAR